MAKEVLLKIVEAEETAETMIKNAKEEMKAKISSAEARVKVELENAMRKAKIECDNLKLQAEKDMESELNSIFEESKKRCDFLVDIPQDKFDEAKKVLIERIVK